MFGPSASDLHPTQRRSPRFPFDSLVRVTAFRLGEENQLWGRSTDLCREGIGVTVADFLIAAPALPLIHAPKKTRFHAPFPSKRHAKSVTQTTRRIRDLNQNP